MPTQHVHLGTTRSGQLGLFTGNFLVTTLTPDDDAAHAARRLGLVFDRSNRPGHYVVDAHSGETLHGPFPTAGGAERAADPYYTRRNRSISLLHCVPHAPHPQLALDFPTPLLPVGSPVPY
jgi:hypothetical protein